MAIENPNAHQVPFVLETEDQDVQDFVVPTEAQLQQLAEEVAEVWHDQDDVTGYLDYQVEQVRNLTVLAKAAENKAKFADRTAQGFKANVEYRRGLIEASLNSAVSRGLLRQPSVKSAEYSLGIQGTAGSVEVKAMLDEWRDELSQEINYVATLLVTQVQQGAPIELPQDSLEHLAELSTHYLTVANPADDKELGIFKVNTTIVFDKAYLKQALKNSWLCSKLTHFFDIVKGKALVIRL